MKTFVVLGRSVYRAAFAVLPAPVMLTVLGRHDIFQAETYRPISVVGILSSDCDYSIPPFYESYNNGR